MAHDLQDRATDTKEAREMSEGAKAELLAMADRIDDIAKSERRVFSMALGALASYVRLTAGVSLDKLFADAGVKR